MRIIKSKKKTKNPSELVSISLSRNDWSSLTAAVRCDPEWQTYLGEAAWKVVAHIEGLAHVETPPTVFDHTTFFRNKLPEILTMMEDGARNGKSAGERLVYLNLLARLIEKFPSTALRSKRLKLKLVASSRK